MKIAATGDWHLNKSIYKGVMDRVHSNLPFRNVDFMNAASFICDKVVNEIKPDVFVIAGDINNNHYPSNLVRGFFSEQLAKLQEAGIFTIILTGNHDTCNKHHALMDIQKLNLKSILVVDKPTIFKFKDKNLLLFPYSLDVEQANISIKDEFYNFVKKAHEEKACENSMFFGHFSVNGAKRNETEEEVFDEENQEIQIVKRKLLNRKQEDISVDDLDAIGSEYVILGDYHRFQILPTKKNIALYVGSIEKSDMSEASQIKGFVLYDDDAEKDKLLGKCRFIEYPNCRPMLEIKGSTDHIRKFITSLNSETYKNAIVKIYFSGDKKDLSNFASSLDGFKSEITNKICPIHIYHAQKATDDEQSEKASVLEKEIMEKGHMEETDVENVVAEMIAERIEDAEEQKLTALLAKEIYRESVAKRKKQ